MAVQDGAIAPSADTAGATSLAIFGDPACGHLASQRGWSRGRPGGRGRRSARVRRGRRGAAVRRRGGRGRLRRCGGRAASRPSWRTCRCPASWWRCSCSTSAPSRMPGKCRSARRASGSRADLLDVAGFRSRSRTPDGSSICASSPSTCIASSSRPAATPISGPYRQLVRQAGGVAGGGSRDGRPSGPGGGDAPGRADGARRRSTGPATRLRRMVRAARRAPTRDGRTARDQPPRRARRRSVPPAREPRADSPSPRT